MPISILTSPSGAPRWTYMGQGQGAYVQVSDVQYVGEGDAGGSPYGGQRQRAKTESAPQKGPQKKTAGHWQTGPGGKAIIMV